MIKHYDSIVCNPHLDKSKWGLQTIFIVQIENIFVLEILDSYYLSAKISSAFCAILCP